MEDDEIVIEGHTFKRGTSILEICKTLGRVRAKIDMNGNYAPDSFPFGTVKADCHLTEDQSAILLAFVEHVMQSLPFEECLAERRKKVKEYKESVSA